MSMRHQWIDEGLDNETMEVVLVALNTPPARDDVSVVRAFQTFQWANASSDGDNTSFSHGETGVIISYDGNIVGIEYGHGSLPEALPDLILVLDALGWSGVDVYSLAVHMQNVLADVARSVPGNMDFEVREGQRGAPVGTLPEAQTLLDQTRFQLASGTEDRVLETFRGLEEPGEPKATPMAVARATPVELTDDEVDDDADSVVIRPAASGQVVGNTGQPQAVVAALDGGPTPAGMLDADESGPRVFSLTDEVVAAPRAAEPVAQGVASAPVGVAAVESVVELPSVATPAAPPAMTTAPAPAAPAASVRGATAVGGERAEWAEVRDALQTSQRVERQLRDQLDAVKAENRHLQTVITTLQSERPVDGTVSRPPADMSSDMNDPNLMRVGRSVFVFIPARSDRSPDSLQQLAAKLQLRPVHLWPGAVGQFVRWDLLGEVDEQFPLLTDTLIHWAFPEAVGVKASFAARELRQFATMPGASFGDIVKLESVPGVPERLAPLELIGRGRAFFDRHLDNDGETFTVRETARSRRGRLFVVHVDTLDGPFAHWIVQLLRTVVGAYAKTEWWASEDVPGERAAEPATGRVITDEEARLLSNLVSRLRAAGVDLNDGQTAN